MTTYPHYTVTFIPSEFTNRNQFFVIEHYSEREGDFSMAASFNTRKEAEDFAYELSTGGDLSIYCFICGAKGIKDYMKESVSFVVPGKYDMYTDDMVFDHTEEVLVPVYYCSRDKNHDYWYNWEAGDLKDMVVAKTLDEIYDA